MLDVMPELDHERGQPPRSRAAAETGQQHPDTGDHHRGRSLLPLIVRLRLRLVMDAFEPWHPVPNPGFVRAGSAFSCFSSSPPAHRAGLRSSLGGNANRARSRFSATPGALPTFTATPTQTPSSA